MACQCELKADENHDESAGQKSGASYLWPNGFRPFMYGKREVPQKTDADNAGDDAKGDHAAPPFFSAAAIDILTIASMISGIT